jgi:3-carboxy-cis,cis-muconate cycloisomerase
MSFSLLDDPLIGPLMASASMRDVFAGQARLGAMIEVEVAIARGQAELGIVPEHLADALSQLTPDDFDMDALVRGTMLSAVPVIPFVKALGSKLAADLEPHVHKGATTQDVFDTADTLLFRRAWDVLKPDIAATLKGLAALARRHAETPMAGRTYGQHAATITFGHRAAGWAAGMVDALDALMPAIDRAMVVSYAGPVGTLAAFEERGPEVRDAFAAELKLQTTDGSWHVLRARRAALGAGLAILIGAAAKMARDVADQVSTEVGELAEPHIAGRGGSSAMPHKRNPVSATVILAAANLSKSHAGVLLDAMVAGGERPAGTWMAEWAALPQLFGLASGVFVEARRLAEGLEVVPERMRANLDLTRGMISADAAAGVIAHHIGREAAHRKVEAAAARVRATGATLLDELLRDKEVAGAVDSESLALAFDWRPAIDAAALWTDRLLTRVPATVSALSA